jgi:hypothetical protein
MWIRWLALAACAAVASCDSRPEASEPAGLRAALAHVHECTTHDCIADDHRRLLAPVRVIVMASGCRRQASALEQLASIEREPDERFFVHHVHLFARAFTACGVHLALYQMSRGRDAK